MRRAGGEDERYRTATTSTWQSRLILPAANSGEDVTVCFPRRVVLKKSPTRATSLVPKSASQRACAQSRSSCPGWALLLRKGVAI